MADSKAARILVDAGGRLKDADTMAMELTGGRAVAGADRREVLPPVVGEPSDILPTRESCPASRCQLFRTAAGPAAWLFHHVYSGDDLVCRFEPLNWRVGLADNLSSIVFVTGTNGWMVYANRALATRLQRAPSLADPAAFAAVAEVLGIGQRLAASLHALALLGDSSTSEGESRWGPVQVETTPLRYFGRVCGALWVVHAAVAPGFADRQALAALTWRLAATYQHQLRNPLQTIQAAVSLLRTDGEHLDRPALLEVIERNTIMISEALEGSLPPFDAPSPRSPVLLSSVVAEAIGDAGRRWCTRGLSFSHEVNGAEPAVQCPTAGLARAFATIFRNAAEARANAHVRVSYHWDQRQVVCVVDDDGPGFPPDVLPGLLQPSNPARHLGLALVAATLEAAGGGAAFGSAACGGARVSLWLPRSVGQAAAARSMAL